MFRKVILKRIILPLLMTIIFLLAFLPTGCSQSFSSNGQRIYFTAESASGQTITYSEGPTTMMRGRLACVNCHGPEGHGGRVTIMMQSFDAPNITWTELTSDSPPFTETTLRQAITQGVDQENAPLNTIMPRWQMSDPDLNDLISFIKTLK